jgi:sensor histidine kinase regulating citrate/malate metabolism
MTAIQNFAASADLQGLIAYLGIMATLLVAVAWASHRDRQKERQKKRALATKAAAAENGKIGRAVADGKQQRAALLSSVMAARSGGVATDLTPVFVAGLLV